MRNQKSDNFDVIGLQLEGDSRWRAMILCCQCGKEVIDIDEAYVFTSSHVAPSYDTVILHDWCIGDFQEGSKPALDGGMTVRAFFSEIVSRLTRIQAEIKRITEEQERQAEEERLAEEDRTYEW